MSIVSHPTSSQEILKDYDQEKNNYNVKASYDKKNKTTVGRGGQNDGVGGEGKRDRRYPYLSLLWYESIRD